MAVAGAPYRKSNKNFTRQSKPRYTAFVALRIALWLLSLHYRCARTRHFKRGPTQTGLYDPRELRARW